MPETERRDRLKEVERIHRAILARMDQSDRRAEEREKERKKRRAELRAAGFKEVSSKEMLAAVKRLSDRVDRMLRKRETKSKNSPRNNRKS